MFMIVVRENKNVVYVYKINTKTWYIPNEGDRVYFFSNEDKLNEVIEWHRGIQQDIVDTRK